MPIPLPVPKSSFGFSTQGRAQPEVSFYFDIVCPYAYLAATQLESLSRHTDAVVRYCPVLLAELLRQHGSAAEAAPVLEGLSGGSPRQRLVQRDLARWAEQLGVPLRIPAAHPRRTHEAMRLLAATAPLQREALAQALLRAYWVEDRDVADVAVLLDIARGAGLDPKAAQGGLMSSAAHGELARLTEAAAQEGVFGVPSFIVDSHHGPRLFFGQDRLHFVEQALRAHPLAAPEAAAQAPARLSPQALMDSEHPANEGRTVTFFYDFSSPFSYLASTQIEAVAAQHGALVRWHPILLGGLFKSLGTPLVPIHTYSEAKRRHAREDLTRWAFHYGQSFHWPSRFPMVTVTALRLALLAGERVAPLSHALFRAYWVEDSDLNDPQVLAQALSSVGLSADLLERVGEPEVKQRLQRNTTEALELGVYGAPSFLVQGHHGPPELFFGQDRLRFVDQALHRGTS